MRKFDPGVTSLETQAVINLSRRTGAKVVTVAGELSDQDFFRKGCRQLDWFSSIPECLRSIPDTGRLLT